MHTQTCTTSCTAQGTHTELRAGVKNASSGHAGISESGMSEVGMIPELRIPYMYEVLRRPCGLWRCLVGRTASAVTSAEKSTHSKGCRLGNWGPVCVKDCQGLSRTVKAGRASSYDLIDSVCFIAGGQRGVVLCCAITWPYSEMRSVQRPPSFPLRVGWQAREASRWVVHYVELAGRHHRPPATSHNPPTVAPPCSGPGLHAPD